MEKINKRKFNLKSKTDKREYKIRPNNIRRKKLNDSPKIKYAPWTEDVERLVLYADIMGFKNRVATTEHKELKQMLIDFRKEWDTKISPFTQNGKLLKFVQFSDSMLIVANGIDSKMFNLISKAGVTLMYVAFNNKFPIKGVIAKGIFTYDAEKQLYFGQPLVDAAVLHDTLKYYGIAVHHTAESIIKKHISNENPYSNNPIYIDRGKVCHYHLCYNLVDKMYKSKDMTDMFCGWLDDISETVSGEPRIYVDKTREILIADKKEYLKNIKVDNEEACDCDMS